MGILKEPAALVKRLPLPVGFSVCELGNQMISGGSAPRPAVDFYTRMGCARYVSIDGNGLGTHTADLNYPLTERLGEFDLVTDFGTGEHIFDQAQVWRTLHVLTKPGGYIAFDRPTQGYGVHGFYLISKSLILDVAEANDYGRVTVETAETPRGWLLRGVLSRPSPARPFMIPQQGRYKASLRLPRREVH